MGRREDPPTLIIHLSDARWCVSLFSPFFGVTSIPLLRPTRAFERAEKKFDRENVLSRRGRGRPLRKLSSSTNRFTFGEKSCGKTRRWGMEGPSRNVGGNRITSGVISFVFRGARLLRTDSPSTSRKIEGGRETNSAARPLFTEKRLLLHTSPYTSR